MAIKKVLLDSSVWLSSLLKEDVNHKKADKIFEKYLSHEYQIIVPQPVLVEIINILNKNYWTLNSIRFFLRKLTKSKNIILLNIINKNLFNSIFKILSSDYLRSQDLYILI